MSSLANQGGLRNFHPMQMFSFFALHIKNKMVQPLQKGPYQRQGWILHRQVMFDSAVSNTLSLGQVVFWTHQNRNTLIIPCGPPVLYANHLISVRRLNIKINLKVHFRTLPYDGNISFNIALSSPSLCSECFKIKTNLQTLLVSNS